MLAKRIIPCLDIKEGKVVKGIQFRHHEMIGDILTFAEFYSLSGADELVFYDITASSEQRTVNHSWIKNIAEKINIPFCVAGGIRNLNDAKEILNAGADKISINSPAIENPHLINELVEKFGQQCVVVGIDSMEIGNEYYICQYTGDIHKTRTLNRSTADWIREVQNRGAGEIVLNCMNRDGMRNGYDIKQLSIMRQITQIPLVASGGAGEMQHFLSVFQESKVDGALAASVFHKGKIEISQLKKFLKLNHIEVRGND